MANTDVQGVLIPLTVSPDGGTTKYTLACLVDNDFKSDFAVNIDESQCGVHVGTGQPRFSFSFNAIVNITPDAVSGGTGQASWKLVQQWHASKTQLLVEQQHGVAGADFYIGGTYYLNSIGSKV